MKEACTNEKLCEGLPPQFLEFMNYATTLEFEQSPDFGYIALSSDFKADLHWMLCFLPSFNGIRMIHADVPYDNNICLDSCLSGCGGFLGDLYYHEEYPDFIKSMNLPICQLEMLNVVVAMKAFGKHLAQTSVQLHCDNAAVVAVLQSGRAKDAFLLKCAREIWLVTAKHDIQLLPVHLPGIQNALADALSRFHLSGYCQDVVNEFVKSKNAKRIHIESYQFKLVENI